MNMQARDPRINPRAYLQLARGSVPPFDALPPLDLDLLGRGLALPALWLREPVTGMRQIWPLPRGLALTVHRMLADGVMPELAPEDEAGLRAIGLVIDPEAVRDGRAAWVAALEAARARLADAEFAVLPRCLSPSHRQAMRAYLERLPLPAAQGDGTGRFRRERYGDPLCRLMHYDLHAAMQVVTGERLRPSYCFLSQYIPGATLRRHTDRPQCAWNATMVLDVAPQGAAAEDWPIHLATRAGTRAAAPGVGEVLVFRGTETPHWRDLMPAPIETYTICFFHFVDEGFSGSLR